MRFKIDRTTRVATLNQQQRDALVDYLTDRMAEIAADFIGVERPGVEDAIYITDIIGMLDDLRWTQDNVRFPCHVMLRGGTRLLGQMRSHLAYWSSEPSNDEYRTAIVPALTALLGESALPPREPIDKAS